MLRKLDEVISRGNNIKKIFSFLVTVFFNGHVNLSGACLRGGKLGGSRFSNIKADSIRLYDLNHLLAILI